MCKYRIRGELSRNEQSPLRLDNAVFSIEKKGLLMTVGDGFDYEGRQPRTTRKVQHCRKNTSWLWRLSENTERFRLALIPRWRQCWKKAVFRDLREGQQIFKWFSNLVPSHFFCLFIILHSKCHNYNNYFGITIGQDIIPWWFCCWCIFLNICPSSGVAGLGRDANPP